MSSKPIIEFTHFVNRFYDDLRSHSEMGAEDNEPGGSAMSLSQGLTDSYVVWYVYSCCSIYSALIRTRTTNRFPSVIHHNPTHTRPNPPPNATWPSTRVENSAPRPTRCTSSTRCCLASLSEMAKKDSATVPENFHPGTTFAKLSWWDFVLFPKYTAMKVAVYHMRAVRLAMLAYTSDVSPNPRLYNALADRI
jgi:hypothetical protein